MAHRISSVARKTHARLALALAGYNRKRFWDADARTGFAFGARRAGKGLATKTRLVKTCMEPSMATGFRISSSL